MNAFRITYRQFAGAPASAQIVHGDTLRDAERKLGSIWSIITITVRCNGTKKDGSPCTRFTTSNQCHAHR